jgi:stage V sporulation protein B
LTNLPISISTALATAIVPSIAASVALKEKKVVMNKVNLAMRVAMMLAAPSAVGLFVLGDPILKMLFPKYPAGGDLLRLGALAVIFQSLVQVATAILQGIGKPNIPAMNAGVGVIIKILLNFFLISIPSVNIKGAIISTIVCYMVIAYLDMKEAIRRTKVNLEIINTFIKPLGAGIGMGVFSFVFYELILWGTANNTVSTLGSILLSIIVYLGILFAIGGIGKEEVLLLPKGEIIASKLIEIGIIRE